MTPPQPHATAAAATPESLQSDDHVRSGLQSLLGVCQLIAGYEASRGGVSPFVTKAIAGIQAILAP